MIDGSWANVRAAQNRRYCLAVFLSLHWWLLKPSASLGSGFAEYGLLLGLLVVSPNVFADVRS
jgi:hypothetical protein